MDYKVTKLIFYVAKEKNVFFTHESSLAVVGKFTYADKIDAAKKAFFACFTEDMYEHCV